jgi:hypothetical protein
MSPLKVAEPGAARFRLEQGTVVCAEIVQVCVAWDSNPFFEGRLCAWARGEDLTDQAAVGQIIGGPGFRVEHGVGEELFGGSDDDETMVAVFGRRRSGFAAPPALGVPGILPNEFIGVGKGVLAKGEGTIRPRSGGTPLKEQEQRDQWNAVQGSTG